MVHDESGRFRVQPFNFHTIGFNFLAENSAAIPVVIRHTLVVNISHDGSGIFAMNVFHEPMVFSRRLSAPIGIPAERTATNPLSQLARADSHEIFEMRFGSYSMCYHLPAPAEGARDAAQSPDCIGLFANGK